VLAALARGPRVLGLLAGLVAATLLLAGLVLVAALLVLTTLARILRVLRILWILIHTSHSSCPSPNSIGRKQDARKQKLQSPDNSQPTIWFGVTAMQCVNVFNLSQKVEMELFHGGYFCHMMSQLWSADPSDGGDLGIKGKYPTEAYTRGRDTRAPRRPARA
jgi:hypothetical protein